MYQGLGFTPSIPIISDLPDGFVTGPPAPGNTYDPASGVLATAAGVFVPGVKPFTPAVETDEADAADPKKPRKISTETLVLIGAGVIVFLAVLKGRG